MTDWENTKSEVRRINAPLGIHKVNPHLGQVNKLGYFNSTSVIRSFRYKDHDPLEDFRIYCLFGLKKRTRNNKTSTIQGFRLFWSRP